MSVISHQVQQLFMDYFLNSVCIEVTLEIFFLIACPVVIIFDWFPLKMFQVQVSVNAQ